VSLGSGTLKQERLSTREGVYRNEELREPKGNQHKPPRGQGTVKGKKKTTRTIPRNRLPAFTKPSKTTENPEKKKKKKKKTNKKKKKKKGAGGDEKCSQKNQLPIYFSKWAQ